VQIKSALFSSLLLLGLAFCLQASSLKAPVPAQEESATEPDQWLIRTPDRYTLQTPDGATPVYFPNGLRQIRCAALQEFLTNPKELDYNNEIKNYSNDAVSSEHVGKIGRFAISDVFHTFDREPKGKSRVYIKLILAERSSGQFCEIFDEVSNGASFSRPSFLVKVSSQTVLASEDPVDGNCGCNRSAYWTADEYGPIFLDVQSLVDEAAKAVVPAGLAPGHGEGFNIRKLTYSYGFSSSDPGGDAGVLNLSFAIRDHQLTVTNRVFNPSHQAKPASP
jgi:hypothetical protein